MDLSWHEHCLRTAAIVRHACSTRAGFEFLELRAEQQVETAKVVGN